MKRFIYRRDAEKILKRHLPQKARKAQTKALLWLLPLRPLWLNKLSLRLYVVLYPKQFLRILCGLRGNFFYRFLPQFT